MHDDLTLTIILQLEVHGNDMDKLFGFVPSRLFPEEYGGKCYTIRDVINEWEAKFEKYRDHFIQDDTFGFVENGRKRDSGEKNMNGVFRSLSID